jgi:hypothetical protein
VHVDPTAVSSMSREVRRENHDKYVASRPQQFASLASCHDIALLPLERRPETAAEEWQAQSRRQSVTQASNQHPVTRAWPLSAAAIVMMVAAL